MTKRNRNTLILAALLIAMAIGLAPMARAAQVAQHTHGHDCQTASSVALNGESHATLTDTNDYAVYRIDLEQRGLLEVTVEPGALDIWGLELLNSSCAVIPGLYSDTSMVTGKWTALTVPHKDYLQYGDPMTWTLDPGAYFVRIRPNPAKVFQDEITYHTKFIAHYGHDIATAEPITMDRPANGELLYPEDREVFQITTTERGQIHAWTAGPSETADKPVVELYYSDGSSGFEQRVSDWEGTGIIPDMLPPGTYYFSVIPQKPDKLGTFTLNLEFTATMMDPETCVTPEIECLK